MPTQASMEMLLQLCSLSGLTIRPKSSKFYIISSAREKLVCFCRKYIGRDKCYGYTNTCRKKHARQDKTKIMVTKILAEKNTGWDKVVVTKILAEKTQVRIKCYGYKNPGVWLRVSCSKSNKLNLKNKRFTSFHVYYLGCTRIYRIYNRNKNVKNVKSTPARHTASKCS